MRNKQDEYYQGRNSWAIWNVPADITENDKQDWKLIEDKFKRDYKPGFFADPDKLYADLTTVKYVIVGQNLGGKGGRINNLDDFHGQLRSLDYRIAAAIYDTNVWGGFMTDLVDGPIDNPTNEIKPEFFTDLENRLNLLGIPTNAKIILMGKKPYDVFQKAGLIEKSEHPVDWIYHYSGKNSHWDAEQMHEKLLKM